MRHARLSREWQDISYDQYRKIWFDTRNALWENTDRPQRLDVFPPGSVFPQAVRMNIVEEGTASPLMFDLDVFDDPINSPICPLTITWAILACACAPIY